MCDSSRWPVIQTLAQPRLATHVQLKRKLQDRFKKLRQGDRLVREYEREFSHIVNCVPYVVRDDKDKADCFVRGLQPKIFKVVYPFKLQTFVNVTHWTFANCEVRVIGRVLSFSRLADRSLTVFRPMARVPRSVVRSLAPKSKNLDFGQLSDWLSGGLVPVQGCACTGTELRTRKPEPRVCIFAGLVPVQGWSCTGTMLMVVPVQPSGLYRYSAAEPCTRASGRSPQAGTPELAYATYVRSCGIEKPTGSSGTDTFQE
uniref:Retrotransposon gag domain-containing protein n=1 Tax=Ananas comosus var. bracteatus TaxID=296719 RepID=A0A6V7QL81_ANACO|nr:unnamed protein product [Ananas comosus var. bracteatus]